MKKPFPLFFFFWAELHTVVTHFYQSLIMPINLKKKKLSILCMNIVKIITLDRADAAYGLNRAVQADPRYEPLFLSWKKLVCVSAFLLLALRYYQLFEDSIPSYLVTGHLSSDSQIYKYAWYYSSKDREQINKLINPHLIKWLFLLRVDRLRMSQGGSQLMVRWRFCIGSFCIVSV